MTRALLFGLLIGLSQLLCLAASAQEVSAQEVSKDESSQEETAPDVSVSEEIDDGCIRYEHGWEEGDVSREKNTRLNTRAFAEHEDKIIRNIRFNNIDVFDEANPEENNRLYLFLNTLHINTKPHVIESQLLFKSGDKVNRKIILESARILRTRNYLTTAYILLDAVCGDEIDILVVTQDSWSLEPQFSLSRQADDTESGFAISDDNVLGSGNSVVIGYEQSADRNSIRYSFSNPHFLNKPLSVKVSFAETSDGDNSVLHVSRPFYSLNTPWSAGIKVEDNSEVSTIRQGGEVINEYRHQHVYEEVFFGLATTIDDNFTRRWYLGLTKEEDAFFTIEDTLLGIPEDRKAVYPWIGYQYLNNQFGVYKNVNQIQRAEDIALGVNFDVRVGYGGTSLDSADEMFRYKAWVTNVLDVSDTHIMEMRVDANGRQHTEAGKQDSSVIGGEIAYHYFLNAKNRWYFRLRYDIGRDLLQHEELTVGDISGMRGYPTDYQRGEKRYVMSIERRYFSDYHLFNLLRMGGVVFFDAGKAWGGETSGDTPLLSNVGFGLRFSSSKVRVGNVVHVDVAMPITAREGNDEVQFLFGASQRF
jgi:hypothetical protein